MSEYIRTNRDDDNGCKDNYDGNFVDTDDKNYQKNIQIVNICHFWGLLLCGKVVNGPRK